jgi:hypothetical protein
LHSRMGSCNLGAGQARATSSLARR